MLGACRARSCANRSERLAQPRQRRCAAVSATREAGPGDNAPDYSEIDSSPFNQTIMALFRRKMVARIGEDTDEQGYAGIIALTRKLNSMYKGTVSLYRDADFCIVVYIVYASGRYDTPVADSMLLYL